MPYFDPWNESAINLDGLSYEEWLDYVFDHPSREPVEAFARGEFPDEYPHVADSWWEQSEPDYKGDPTRLMGFATRLFNEPRILMDRYTRGQIREGLWFLPRDLNDWLWDCEAVSRDACKSCIGAMYNLFDRFFVDEQLGDTAGMWWDFFRAFGERPDPDVVSFMFETLCKLLEHPSLVCCGAALHGLGHLPHPAKEAPIRAFLARRTDLDNDWRRYAEAAIAGEVL
jgi:hypothetical protein